MRALAAMLLGLALAGSAWGLARLDGVMPGTAGADRAERVFAARWLAHARATPAGAHQNRDCRRCSLPMDPCEACLGVCRDQGEGYAACLERCCRSCGLDHASAWAEAE